jgi:hypothetical protein
MTHRRRREIAAIPALRAGAPVIARLFGQAGTRGRKGSDGVAPRGPAPHTQGMRRRSRRGVALSREPRGLERASQW